MKTIEARVLEVYETEHRLTTWEADFLDSVENQNSLTDKQEAILAQIEEKVGL